MNRAPRGRGRLLIAGVGLLLGLFLWGIAGCRHEADSWTGLGGPPRVLVSFPPLYSFTKSVAGNNAAVLSLLTNQGPHGYEFQQRDVLLLREADIFFVNGLGLDDVYTERMTNSSGNPNLAYVQVGKRIPKNQVIALGKKVKHGDHYHTGSDPHIWLGIPQAIEMVGVIRDELKKVDPTHAAGYENRAQAYIAELEQLQKDGEAALKGKEIKIVSFHGALNYFARTFGLKVVDSIQVDPERETPAGELKGIAEHCAQEGVHVLAIEPQFPQSSKLAGQVADAVVKKGQRAPAIITLDPLETVDPRELDAGWYVRKMRENLEQLAGAVK
jgi:ABC-type Zn uptake system ZnuABC Zn-binding protein ZnuA